MEKAFIGGIIGFCIGSLAITMMLNFDAQKHYTENPNITLKEYWGTIIQVTILPEKGERI